MEQVAKERDQPPPAFLKDKPELSPPWIFYWTSFWELSTCRYELGSIPWTALNDYCIRWGINSIEEFDLFSRIIRAMDNAYREHINGERERKMNERRPKKK